MKNYLCTIDTADSKEFLMYDSKRGTLGDLANTLENTSLPVELMEGLTPEKIREEAAQWQQKKMQKYTDISKKYNWENKYHAEQIFIYEDGKVYYFTNNECDDGCSCNKNQ